MSFVISDTLSIVFANPKDVPFATRDTSTTATLISTSSVSGGGTQLGGGTTYTLAPIPAGSTGNLVVSGTGTLVNLNTGALNATIIGGGGMIEASAAGNIGKTIELSSKQAYNASVVVPITKNLVGGTIQDALGNITLPAAPGTAYGIGQQNPGFAFYAHSGAGDDLIQGSSENDFIRGGAGNDTINGFGGNDVIRGGSGADSITGGAGNDTLYYTSDQLDGSTDTFTDFNAKGIDKIAVQRTAVPEASSVYIAGLGTKTITFIASGTKVVSAGTVINIADIQIV